MIAQLLRRLAQNTHRLTPPRGALRIDGLPAPVQVRFDAHDVAHVYGDSQEAVFFAQGYLTARERLFQMDYNRHAAAGRLCELVGDRPLPWRDLSVHLKGCSTLDVDILLRTFGLVSSAEASLRLHSAACRDMLDAYSRGVNAYIAEGHRAVEHRMLRVPVRPWEPVDSMLMVKAMAFELNFAWRAILLGALLADAQVPEPLAKVVWPHVAQGTPHDTIVAGWGEAAQELLALRQVASAGMGMGQAPGAGSNCVVVSGRRSADGGALLANDTHLPVTIPAVWYEAGLHADGLDLHGFSIPGVPGVALGRSRRHAWGITAGLVHDLDLFVEKLNPANPAEVLTPQGYVPLQRREEVFVIRGSHPVRRTVETSRHGPLLAGVATRPPRGYRLAICWTGHGPSRELDALMGAWQARSPEDLVTCMRVHGCPSYNVSYADADGRIGYTLAGTLPGRRRDTPVRPLEGWTDTWTWGASLPTARNPHSIDPEEGFIVTANHRIVPRDQEPVLGDLFEPAGRQRRMAELLRNAGDALTLDDLQRLQGDTHSQFGLALRAALWQLVGNAEAWAAAAPHPELGRRAAEVWHAWDGAMDIDSPGAAVAMMTACNFARNAITALAGETAARAFIEMNSLMCDVMVALAQSRALFAEHGVDLLHAAQTAFGEAVAALTTRGGPDPQRWRWGDWHQWLGKHALHHSPAGALLDLGPFPMPGGPDTVCRGDMLPATPARVAASMRFVANTGQPLARSIVPGGQSGSPASPFYDDQVQDYLHGRLKAARFHLTETDGAVRVERWSPKRSPRRRTPRES